MVSSSRLLGEVISNSSLSGRQFISKFKNEGKGLRQLDINEFLNGKKLKDLTESDVNKFLEKFGLSLDKL
jgi:hypothetical protein